MIDPAAAVAHTAAKLDNVDPHWADEDRIDLSIFASNTYRKCVIGQSFYGKRGKYERDPSVYAHPALAGRDVEVQEIEEALNLDRVDIANLASHDAEWRKEIERRRAANAAAVDPILTALANHQYDRARHLIDEAEARHNYPKGDA